MTENVKRTHRFRLNTVTGFMVSLATRLPVPDTGPVGTAQQQNSSVSVGFCTMKEPGPVIGQRTSKDVKSIVSKSMMKLDDKIFACIIPGGFFFVVT